ncbi:hypothetical protein NKW55_10400 [Gluconobacter kondonii]|uniref:hypothetical protein n=1 Tax=Gluconobacter kondonii TaxID=941463 RepID=UPI00209F061D|nr:hypothetical protein [Gluconobacter kondonii]MCP1237014.1 hypothetical protein [Gluconobacter kondonii]
MEIDAPDIKRQLWVTMRRDLVKLVPYLKDTEKLICPLCGRLLCFEEFSLEHILPQQGLKCDPDEVRSKYSKNERAGLTLTCKSPLKIKGKKIATNGCNGWKGMHYDKAISDTMKYQSDSRRLGRHTRGALVAAFLGLFKKFGYSVVLTSSGAIMRKQFLLIDKFCRELPDRCTIMLSGETPKRLGEVPDEYWNIPIWVNIPDDNVQYCSAGYRSVSVCLPLSRNPRVPINTSNLHVPDRYILRPNLQTFVD